MYPKVGAKKKPNCTDSSCFCCPFRNLTTPRVKLCKHQGTYSLIADNDIEPNKLIIEYIGEVIADPTAFRVCILGTGSWKCF